MRFEIQKNSCLQRPSPLLLAAWFLLVAWTIVGADAVNTTVEPVLDRDTVYVGDPISYTIDVVLPPEITWQPPPPGEHLGPFEVRDYQILRPEEEKDAPSETRIQYTLVPFTTGDLEIPPVKIVIADSSGPSDTLSAPGQMIAVASLHPDPQGDIRDIKPPMKLSGGWAWIWWLIGGAFLAVGGLFISHRLRRKKLGQALEEIAYQGPPRPAHRIALEELARIGSLNLIQKGFIKRFYIEISEAIRRYIGRRYGIQTMERTTEELMAEMRQAVLPREHIDAYRAFFQECDLVKFAKHIPAQDRLDRALDGARELVMRTREELVIGASPSGASTQKEEPAATMGSTSSGKRD